MIQVINKSNWNLLIIRQLGNPVQAPRSLRRSFKGTMASGGTRGTLNIVPSH